MPRLQLFAIIVSLLLIVALPPPRALAGAPARGQASAHQAGTSAAVQRWTYPVAPPGIARRFERPPQRWAAGHRGIDFRARPGQSVRAIGAGRVRYAAKLAGRGVLVVEHGPLRSTYEPVAAAVRVGDRVAIGERIGSVTTGSGHCGSGQCLHLGVRRGDDYLNPLALFGHHRVVLVPW